MSQYANDSVSGESTRQLSAYGYLPYLQSAVSKPHDPSAVCAAMPASYYGSSASSVLGRDQKVRRLTELDRPIRVAHLNAALLPAGIEFWLSALVNEVNPNRLKFLRYVAMTDLVDVRQVSKMGMPVEVGQRDSVRSAVQHSDILMVSDPGTNAVEVGKWVREADPKLTVFIAHGDGEYTCKGLLEMVDCVDHVVAVSDHVKRTLPANLPVTVIRNGVDPRRLIQTRSRQETRDILGFAANDFVLGFVGRFSEEKNPNLIVSAIKKLPRRYKALLVGYGNMQKEIASQCAKEIPGRYVVLDGDDYLGDLFSAMDAHCLPSRLEGYGLVTMEAMMCRKPVIVTPYGLTPDLIHDHVNGLVVQPSADSIAEAAQLLGEHPRVARTIAAEGHRTAQRFGYASQMARSYEDLMESLFSKMALGA